METMAQERKLTEAERADEAARMQRARTGQQLPRTLHALCEQSARLIDCQHCGTMAGRPCRRPGGYHLHRFVRAYVRGLVRPEEFAVILSGLDVFTVASIVRDGAR